MPHIVTGRCDNCKYTECVDVCPVECFHEAPTMLYIDPEVCIECDACVPVCPVEAIFPDDEVPERYKEYIKINAEVSLKYPIINESKEPLPGAKTLEEIKKKEEAEGNN